MARLLIIALVLAFSQSSQAQSGAELRNWFDDPFFQISNAVPDCPLPRGPLITQAQWQGQAHQRVERGTSCWLAGKCERPNSFAYDKDIELAIKDALSKVHPFADTTTLWVTIQARVVFVEGCARRPEASAQAETFMRGLPYVQQVISNTYRGPPEKPPYPVVPPK